MRVRQAMPRLEDLHRDAVIRGVTPSGLVTVVDVRWHGSNVVELTYKDSTGRLGSELLYRDREPTLELVTAGRPWSFDGDGALLRLVSEAYRIRLAHLFDPYVAVQISRVDPLPHQITAVYGELLTRQPLRFLLADDPGSGKTIMTGLFIKELMLRGDLRRCLICCPGNLAEQWQDELARKFLLDFTIIRRDAVEASRTGNPLAEIDRAIIRLDHFSRNDDLQERLAATDWDLIVCDEAHKMSASYFGSELKETRRYKLGRLLGTLTRHFLLLTATPHNGKEADFQLFMALLDGDRFEGRFRDGAHTSDTSDLIRRLTKEQMVRFDGRPLFPERWAHTVTYELSDPEAILYKEVTDYVRDQMNRADRLGKEGEEKRATTVGFALTVLQRRLASSPAAISQSLTRRRTRLEKRLDEARVLKRGADATRNLDLTSDLPTLDPDDVDELDDAPDDETATLEQAVVDQATTARTIAELEAEIAALKELEILAKQVRNSGKDRKWEQLSSLLQDTPEMFDASGSRRKLVVFTEHRDTLDYLRERVTGLLGKPAAVVVIHGALAREERANAQERFRQDRDVQFLIATDAAGEGINLQNAHLMVNYDLPWNPNRLEQRFGRIHRIGQNEVCHMWNLVADKTREGEVFLRLLDKLAQERKALGGRVFDVLGKLFCEQRLRDLLIEAIRYGDQPEVRARLEHVVDQATDREHLRQLLEDTALSQDFLDAARVRELRDLMERAEAHRLQPHFIEAFFKEAFRLLGGTLHSREADRFELTHVPATMRNRDRQLGQGAALLSRYQRITFHKNRIQLPGKPMAEFVCPGHPLLDTLIDLVEERHRDILKRGAVLLDPDDRSDSVRVLIYLEHAIQDGRLDPRTGQRRVVSRQLHFLEMEGPDQVRTAGYAPYLDYAPATPDELAALDGHLAPAWLTGGLDTLAITYAAQHLVPSHLADVRERKDHLVRKTETAVRERLTTEIQYWDFRAIELQQKEEAGKTTRLNSRNARQRADELQARLAKRLEELEQERHLSALAPVVLGGALVVARGLVDRVTGRSTPDHPTSDPISRKRVEELAIQAVVETERRLGRTPRVMPPGNPGYDLESRCPDDGALLFIEVKGRAAGARTVTLTKTEVLTGLNKRGHYILALVEVDDAGAHQPAYVREPFQREPDFTATSVNYDLPALLEIAGPPA